MNARPSPPRLLPHEQILLQQQRKLRQWTKDTRLFCGELATLEALQDEVSLLEGDRPGRIFALAFLMLSAAAGAFIMAALIIMSQG